ncbi:hypothetical protein BDV25DRAFT_172717 [Aspergillus avenaceus]|uniref:Uncharacterized protein n=1 Tax=Aspergillus avenaceus TaxID=36643 RepID=A0A5N6TTH8_ASPAV|nr:hypothetical protein BDV25DRAFT_172717 [Aspergillus avenaceus]
MTTKATLLIYTGSPLDSPEYRHTALHFDFPTGRTSTMHVIGTQGLFTYQELQDADPTTTSGRELARSIPIADIDDLILPENIRRVVASTPVRNGRGDLDWNCQNWVADALGRLVAVGVLSEGVRERAVDGMVEGCLEGRDLS